MVSSRERLENVKNHETVGIVTLIINYNQSLQNGYSISKTILGNTSQQQQQQQHSDYLSHMITWHDYFHNPQLYKYSSSATPTLHTHLDIRDVHHAAAIVHVLLEIHLHVLKDKHERKRRVDDVVQGDDVGVFQVLQERDFSDGCTRSSFLVLETDILQRYYLACDTVVWVWVCVGRRERVCD